MDGALMHEGVDEGALLANLGPETMYGRTVGDRRFWLLLLRNAAIASGHPQTTELLLNEPELIVDPLTRSRQILEWLHELLIADPASAAAVVRDARPRILKWGKWQGWSDELLVFSVMNLGDAVMFAAETFKAAPLAEAERAELYESITALARLMGLDDPVIPVDHAAHRAYMDEQLRDTISRRAVHDMVGRLEAPCPDAIPSFLWTAGQVPSRHLVRIVLGATLPDITRERYGLELSAREGLEWAAIERSLWAFGALPDRVRLVPAARRDRGERLAA